MKLVIVYILLALLVGGIIGFLMNNSSQEINTLQTEKLQLETQISEMNKKISILENNSTKETENDQGIPQNILDVANQEIIRLVGDTNFNNLYNLSSSRFIANNPNTGEHPYYRLTYDLDALNYSFYIHVSEEGVVDLTGGTNFAPIPNCVEFQTKCNFISKSEAISIAEQNDFEGDKDNWKVSAYWDARNQTDSYVWQIYNKEQRPHPEYGGCIVFGKYMRISSYSGEVLSEDISYGCP